MKTPPTLADGIIREWMRPKYRPFDPNNWLSNHVAAARKFVLDESMSAFMGDLAYASLKTCHTHQKAHLLLESMRKLSRLPHAATWIEYDMKAKRRRVHEAYNQDVVLGDDVVPDRSGWLLMQHPKLDTAFMAIHCASHTWTDGRRDEQPQGSFFAYAWTSDDSVPPWPRDPLFAQEYPVNVRDKGIVMARPEGILSGVTQYKTDSVAVVMAPHITREVAEAYLRGTRRHYNPLGELASDLRYLWSLLATINCLPTKIQGVKPDRGYVARGKYRKFSEHSVITLTVPVTRYRQLANRAIAIARRRGHQVRGHFRKDRWHPGEKIWIREHVRGDTSLGFVTHDYEVTHDMST